MQTITVTPDPALHRSPGGSMPRAKFGNRWNFAEWFVLSQTVLPALLYLPGSQDLRVPIRMASYGISLAALAYWLATRKNARTATRLHPAAPWLLLTLVYLALMVVHPGTNTILAGVAQVVLYLSVLAPVFWAPRFVESTARLQRLLWLTLLCSGINAFVGVMQVRNPDAWMPREFSSIVMESEFGLGRVVYEGADGRTIIRPPGLGDSPGAVAGPATFALYFGLIFVVSKISGLKRLLAAGLATLGAAAIFLTLVRASLLTAGSMILGFIVLQIRQRRFARAGSLMLIALTALTVAFIQSAVLGGESLTSRFRTIIEEDPISVYYESRGIQVAEAFTQLLPEFPLGAGLGRWGMMYNYFGDANNAAAEPIWVEIQWPGWIVDGGIVLLVLYPISILVAVGQQLRAAIRGRDEEIRSVAAAVFGANLGLLVLCFSYPVFASPLGTQFWFLSGALMGAAAGSIRAELPAAGKALH